MTYWIYIVTNKRHTTLYVGVTGNIRKRIEQHKQSEADGFTRRYQCKKLVYAESTTEVMAAIEREKQIKRWNRSKKEALIATINPRWDELSVE